MSYVAAFFRVASVLALSIWAAYPLFSQDFTGDYDSEEDIADWPFKHLIEEPMYAYSWNLAVPGNENLDFSAYPYMHLWAVIRHQTLRNRTPEQMVAHMESMPEGHRVMFIFLIDRWMTDCTNHNHSDPPHPAYHCPEEEGQYDATLFTDTLGVCSYDTLYSPTLWWDNGAEWLRGLLDSFFYAYRAAGGELDVVIMDTEKKMRSTMGGSNNSNPCTQFNWKTIENDPRFQRDSIMEMLTDMGWAPDTADLSGGLYGNRSIYLPESYYNNLVWREVMENRAADYYNYAVYEPAKRYFPDVKVSNYGFFYHSPEYSVPHHGGLHAHLLGRGAIVGNRQARSLYSPRPRSDFPNRRVSMDTLMKYHPGFFPGDTPFFGLIYDVNRMRAMYLSAPDVPIHPWINWKWQGGSDNLLYDNDLYWEKVIHLGMTNADAWLYFFSHSNPTTPANHPLMNELTIEFNHMLGYEGRKTLVDSLVKWDAPAVVTGMEIEDMRILRFSPDPDSVFAIVSPGGEPDCNQVWVRVGSEDFIFDHAVIYKYPNSTAGMGLWILQQMKPSALPPENEVSGIPVFPNPAKNTVYFDLRNTEAHRISLINSLGRTVLSHQKPDKFHPANTESLPPGVYFYKIHGRHGSLIDSGQLVIAR